MMHTEVNQAIEILKNGGLLLLPTDIDWVIACDATNSSAVDKLLSGKIQTEENFITILLDADNKLQSYLLEVPEMAYDLIEYTEKPLVIIYEHARNLAPDLLGKGGNIAIRIVKDSFCKQLLQRFRKPLASYSLDTEQEYGFVNILDDYSDKVDLYIKSHETNFKQIRPTIMKLSSNGKFSFVRK